MTSLGVIFHPSFPPETLADYARRAEAGGFDELWLWDDCFLPGALTSAAIALSATRRITLGIGLLPVKAYHPLFAAMEITTLARAFPGRLIVGFGHGVGSWMTQIGAASKSPLAALHETVIAVRALLAGEAVTMHGDHVNLADVQMQLTAVHPTPLYVGAMREKTLRLAGQIGNGTILPAMSSPAYVRWARTCVDQEAAPSGPRHRLAVFAHAKVSRDGAAARAAVRRALASDFPWAEVQVAAAGLSDEVGDFVRQRGAAALETALPDAWMEALAAAGTPGQAAAALARLAEAGADSLVLQPLNGDPDCLDEYIAHLLPLLAPLRS